MAHFKGGCGSPKSPKSLSLDETQLQAAVDSAVTVVAVHPASAGDGSASVSGVGGYNPSQLLLTDENGKVRHIPHLEQRGLNHC